MTVSDPRDAERAKAQAWNAEFEAALAPDRGFPIRAQLPHHRRPAAPGLAPSVLGRRRQRRVPYWASAGLVVIAVPADTQATVTLHYRRQSPEGERFERDEKPLATLDIGTTDPHLIAALLLVTAAQHHRTTL